MPNTKFVLSSKAAHEIVVIERRLTVKILTIASPLPLVAVILGFQIYLVLVALPVSIFIIFWKVLPAFQEINTIRKADAEAQQRFSVPG